ncbi:MAG: N-acetylmuramoyl-L-alanine amidase [Rhodospirillales bacterium]|nr:N-acetylmuramoyl-L-alanine amidase [Rhodospirillales bacterium]
MRIVERPSPNFGPRRDAPIDLLVLHYTGMRDAKSAIARLCDPAAEVSAHWLIDEDGTIVRLVDEAQRAWHAGASRWRGIDDVNSHSIGIELVNPGHEFGYREFPAAQMDALLGLAHEILARHGAIDARNVLAHSDVAPARKLDPGEKFDWRRLAAHGIGLWPATPQPTSRTLVELLGAYGYDTSDAKAAIAAFQRRFRTARIDGADDDECREVAAALLKAAGLHYL